MSGLNVKMPVVRRPVRVRRAVCLVQVVRLSGPSEMQEMRRRAGRFRLRLRLRLRLLGLSRSVADADFGCGCGCGCGFDSLRRSAAAWFRSVAVAEFGSVAVAGAAARCVSSAAAAGCGCGFRFVGAARLRGYGRVSLARERVLVRRCRGRWPIDRVQLKVARRLVLAGGRSSHPGLLRKTPWSPCKISCFT